MTTTEGNLENREIMKSNQKLKGEQSITKDEMARNQERNPKQRSQLPSGVASSFMGFMVPTICFGYIGDYYRASLTKRCKLNRVLYSRMKNINSLP